MGKNAGEAELDRKGESTRNSFQWEISAGNEFIFQQEITSLGELNWRYVTFCFAYYFTVLVGFLYFFPVYFLLKGEGSCKLMKNKINFYK